MMALVESTVDRLIGRKLTVGWEYKGFQSCYLNSFISLFVRGLYSTIFIGYVALLFVIRHGSLTQYYLTKFTYT